MVYGNSIEEPSFAAEPPMQLKWALLYPVDFEDEPSDLEEKMNNFSIWLVSELSLRGRLFGHYIGISPTPEVIIKISKQQVTHDCHQAYQTIHERHPGVLLVLHILGGEQSEYNTMCDLALRYGLIRQGIKLSNALNGFAGVDFEDVAVKICSWISRRCSQLASSKTDTDRGFRLLRTVLCHQDADSTPAVDFDKTKMNSNFVARINLTQSNFHTLDLRAVVHSVLHPTCAAIDKATMSCFGQSPFAMASPTFKDSHGNSSSEEDDEDKENQGNRTPPGKHSSDDNKKKTRKSGELNEETKEIEEKPICRVIELPKYATQFTVAGYFAPFEVADVKMDVGSRCAIVHFSNKFQMAQAVATFRREPPADGPKVQLQPMESSALTKRVVDFVEFVDNREAKMIEERCH